MNKLLSVSLLGSCMLTAAALVSPGAQAANAGDHAKFKLDEVTFDGNKRVSTETLQGIVGIAPGDKVDRDSIVQAFNNVVAEYGKENVGGNIQPTMSYPSPGHIDVNFAITEEAPPVATKVDPIMDHETFTGNVKISSALLEPALTIKTGTAVTKEQIVADLNGIAKIYQGANLAVKITPQVTQNAAHVDLNFVIDESPPKKAD